MLERQEKDTGRLGLRNKVEVEVEVEIEVEVEVGVEVEVENIEDEIKKLWYDQKNI